MVLGPEVSAGLGTCKKCRLSGPTPDLLIQKLEVGLAICALTSSQMRLMLPMFGNPGIR